MLVFLPLRSSYSNISRSEILNQTPCLRTSTIPHHHLHHSPLLALLWMVRHLKKLSTWMSKTQQQPQYWNLTHLHLGHRRRRREFFRLFSLFNLNDSCPIYLRIYNYRPRQTPILPMDRYRPNQTLLQPWRVSILTLKRPIRSTAAAPPPRIMHISEQVPRRFTSKSFQLAALVHVLNSVHSHAVASQLTESSAVTAQTQPAHMERYDF